MPSRTRIRISKRSDLPEPSAIVSEPLPGWSNWQLARFWPWNSRFESLPRSSARAGSVRGSHEHVFVEGTSRPKRTPGQTRRLVAELKGRGLSYREIAHELGTTKSTVAYHARRLGIPAKETFARRYDWNEIQAAVDGGASMRECMERFGFCRDAWGKAVQRGELVPNDWVTPLDELLTSGRRRSRGHIKRRLLREGVKTESCEHCGLSEWRGRPLSLQLHHINGDGNDNRLENLELLCANCHSQTDTYGGRNGHRRRKAA